MLAMAQARLRRVLEPALKRVDAWRRQIIPQIVRGILVGGSTVITEVARHSRKADQSFEAARKSIENHLTSRAWDWDEPRAAAELERWVGRDVDALTPIWIDNTEIAKTYAEAMEGLGWIRDADESSHRGETRTEPGYWKLDAFAGAWDGTHPIPLAQLVYGIDVEGPGNFDSENEARSHLYDRIVAATEGRGVLVEDRGFDGDVNFQLLRARNLHFLIRLVGERYVNDPTGKTIGSAREVGRRVPIEGSTVLKFDRRGHKVRWEVRFGWREVRLPHVEGSMWLLAAQNVRARTPDERWLFFLTTVPIPDRRAAERLLKMYVGRWKAEEAIRFLKSDLGLEKVRALSFRALRRLVQMAYWAMLVVALVLRDAARATIEKLETLAEILPKQAAFLFYRVRWALAKLLAPPVSPLASAGLGG